MDLDGIKDRLLAAAHAGGELPQPQSVGSTLYYIRQGSKDAKPAFQLYDLAARKETALGSVNGYEISADGKKMLVRKDGKYGIIDLPKAPVDRSAKPLDLSGMEMQLDRQKEWKQIFHECWRQMRDFFYDPEHARRRLAGACGRSTSRWWRHVNHRADLTYVIGEMIGELNAGHAYVGGGEMPRRRAFRPVCSARESRSDTATGYYQIDKILRGADWERKPALAADRDRRRCSRTGDYIIAIDGQPANEMLNIYEALVNKAGKQVTLKVNAEPREKGSREVVVTPIARRGGPLLLRLGRRATSRKSPTPPAARSATSTFPTCRPTA